MKLLYNSLLMQSVFFIECGGLDGEDFSNTLSMEMTANWTGVLVEASPTEFKNLMNKKRKSILIPTCLSLEPRPTTVRFYYILFLFF